VLVRKREGEAPAEPRITRDWPPFAPNRLGWHDFEVFDKVVSWNWTLLKRHQFLEGVKLGKRIELTAQQELRPALHKKWVRPLATWALLNSQPQRRGGQTHFLCKVASPSRNIKRFGTASA